jgi:hypothetical protein
MKPWPALVIFVFVATAAADDLVNERLTASAAAREAHWGVDCSATMAALRAGRDTSVEVEDALTKCRFIHQPPGAGEAAHCPDYRSILAAYRTRNAETLRDALQSSQHCPGPLPAGGHQRD